MSFQVPEVNTRRHDRASSIADDIDFEIKGTEMQFVEIELDPGESAIAEAGAMMFKASGITMNAVFGDGSGQDAGFMNKLLGAGKRLLTGESRFHPRRNWQSKSCFCVAVRWKYFAFQA